MYNIMKLQRIIIFFEMTEAEFVNRIATFDIPLIVRGWPTAENIVNSEVTFGK